MAKDYQYGSHSVTRLIVHLVWVTKYRYKVLTGDIQKRCREFLTQVCDTEDVVNEYLKRHKSSANDQESFKLD